MKEKYKRQVKIIRRLFLPGRPAYAEAQRRGSVMTLRVTPVWVKSGGGGEVKVMYSQMVAGILCAREVT